MSVCGCVTGGGGVGGARRDRRKLVNTVANMSTEIKLVYYFFQRGKKNTKQKSSHILH